MEKPYTVYKVCFIHSEPIKKVLKQASTTSLFKDWKWQFKLQAVGEGPAPPACAFTHRPLSQCSVKINVHLIKLDSTHSTYLSVSVISNRANECDTDAFQLLPLLLLLCFYDTWAVCWGAAVPDIAPVLCLLETSDNSRPFLTSQEPDSHEEVKCMNEWVDVRVGFMT